jgi:membrane protein YqaA with SNARE-associated domain
MSRIGDAVRVFALTLGAPGLFVVAFLDSSFLSLPEIADILVVWMVTQNTARVALYVVSVTLGSVAGCLLLYSIGRKGGEALLRRRFAPGNVDRARATLKRHSVMTVLIASILPPPAPFKIFVLLAGASGMSPGRFAATIAVGRGARYLTLGILAVYYGDRALAYAREHGVAVALAAVGVLLAGLAAYLAWSRRRQIA